jgi:hypothetical protein
MKQVLQGGIVCSLSSDFNAMGRIISLVINQDAEFTSQFILSLQQMPHRFT